jgi:hypothetical protein
MTSLDAYAETPSRRSVNEILHRLVRCQIQTKKPSKNWAFRLNLVPRAGIELGFARLHPLPPITVKPRPFL